MFADPHLGGETAGLVSDRGGSGIADQHEDEHGAEYSGRGGAQLASLREDYYNGQHYDNDMTSSCKMNYKIAGVEDSGGRSYDGTREEDESPKATSCGAAASSSISDWCFGDLKVPNGDPDCLWFDEPRECVRRWPLALVMCRQIACLSYGLGIFVGTLTAEQVLPKAYSAYLTRVNVLVSFLYYTLLFWRQEKLYRKAQSAATMAYMQMEDARRARGGHLGSHKSKTADQRGCGADLYVAIPEQDAATSCSYHQHSAIHLSDQRRGATTMQDEDVENQNEDEHDDVLEHDMSKGTSCEHLGRASLMLAEEQIAGDIRELHLSPTTNASFFMKLRIKEHEKAVLTKIVRVLQEWVIIVSLLICVVYWAGLHRQEEYTPITSNLYIEKKITAQGPFGRWEARVTVENLQELELLQDMSLLMEDAFVAERAARGGGGAAGEQKEVVLHIPRILMEEQEHLHHHRPRRVISARAPPLPECDENHRSALAAPGAEEGGSELNSIVDHGSPAAAGFADEHVQPGNAGATRWRLEDFVSKKRGRGHGELGEDEDYVYTAQLFFSEEDHGTRMRPPGPRRTTTGADASATTRGRQEEQRDLLLSLLQERARSVRDRLRLTPTIRGRCSTGGGGVATRSRSRTSLHDADGAQLQEQRAGDVSAAPAPDLLDESNASLRNLSPVRFSPANFLRHAAATASATASAFSSQASATAASVADAGLGEASATDRGSLLPRTAADRARVAATRALVAQYVADYSANSNQGNKPFRYPLVKKLFDHSKQRRQAAFVLTVLEHGIIVFASLTELLLVKQSFTFGRMALLLLCLIFYCFVNAAWTLAEGYPIYPIILDWVESPVLSLGFIVLLTLVFCGIYWLLMRFCSTPRTVNGAAGKMLKGMNGARKRSGVSSCN